MIYNLMICVSGDYGMVMQIWNLTKLNINILIDKHMITWYSRSNGDHEINFIKIMKFVVFQF